MISDETIVARFYGMLGEGREGKVGQLVITPEGMEMRDLVVVTLFVVQEKTDESKMAVCFQSLGLS